MNLREHDGRDGMKVWLSQREVDLVFGVLDDTTKRITTALGVRCGLRSAEVLDVTPQHVVDTDAGRMLRVFDGKGGKYRETPIPQEWATTIRTVADVRDESEDFVLVDRSTRTLRRWMDDVGEQLAQETGEDAWRHLSFHDLRRTWATALASEDVDPLLVCDWGGWSDLETFLNHYRGTFSPEAQRRERTKVSWL